MFGRFASSASKGAHLFLAVLLFGALLAPPVHAQGAVASDDRATTAIDRAMDAVVTVVAGEPGDDSREPGKVDGSGFVYDASGLILTNAHVVSKAEVVTIGFRDGRIVRGQVIGRDGRTDLAVIRIQPDRALSVLPLAADPKVPLGTRVYALGSPLGRLFSVSAGIVGGYDRQYDVAWPVNFIQHDASLNPGNSGGPLITEDGMVIGINTATPPETLFDIGIGLAIPSTLARRIADELVAKGRIERGRLGISASSADGAMAAALGNPGSGGGLLVDDAPADGLAAKAGLRKGDLILRVAGKRMALVRDLTMALLDSRPGQTVTLEVMRGGKTLKIMAPLEADDDRAGERGRSSALSIATGTESGDFSLGIGFGVGRDGSGVAIARVDDMSIAQMYGLYAGDRVETVNGRAVASAAEAEAALAAATGEVVVIGLRREGQGGFHIALPLSAEAAVRRRPGQPSRLPQGPL